MISTSEVERMSRKGKRRKEGEGGVFSGEGGFPEEYGILLHMQS